MDSNKTAPFYIGERVIAVDALPKAIVKNGLQYTVYSCEMDFGQDRNLYWYVGVEGNGTRTHNRVRPSIFASLVKGKMMTFEKMNEEISIHAN